MAIEHLSHEDIDRYVTREYGEQELRPVIRHLRECQRCHREVQQYERILHEMKQAKLYEPDADFVDRMTANLPPVYARNQSSIFEIASFVLVLIPFAVILGLLLSSNTFGSRLSKAFIAVAQSFSGIFGRIQMEGDSLLIFGMLAGYLLIFKLLDRFLTRYRTDG